MKLLIKRNTSGAEESIAKESATTPVQSQQNLNQQNQNQQDLVKQEIRQQIDQALRSAQTLPPGDRTNEIRCRLAALQNYCTTVNKTFIVVEQIVTCDRFDLGGSTDERAILFRGPKEEASVAICVTEKGSLLHRNSSPWCVYRNEGDIFL